MLRVIDEVADAGEDQRRPPGGLFAAWREPRALPRPLDKNSAELFLKILDLHRKRWLRHRAKLSRAAEMKGLCKRIEIAKLLQRNVGHKPILSQLQIIKIDLMDRSFLRIRTGLLAVCLSKRRTRRIGKAGTSRPGL